MGWSMDKQFWRIGYRSNVNAKSHRDNNGDYWTHICFGIYFMFKRGSK